MSTSHPLTHVHTRAHTYTCANIHTRITVVTSLSLAIPIYRIKEWKVDGDAELFSKMSHKGLVSSLSKIFQTWTSGSQLFIPFHCTFSLSTVPFFSSFIPFPFYVHTFSFSLYGSLVLSLSISLSFLSFSLSPSLQNLVWFVFCLVLPLIKKKVFLSKIKSTYFSS